MLEGISDVSVNSTDPGLVGCWGDMCEVSGIGEGESCAAILFEGGARVLNGSYLSEQGYGDGGGSLISEVSSHTNCETCTTFFYFIFYFMGLFKDLHTHHRTIQQLRPPAFDR